MFALAQSRLRRPGSDGLCNFIRIHKTLRVPPAMKAGVMDRFFTDDEFVDIVDE